MKSLSGIAFGFVCVFATGLLAADEGPCFPDPCQVQYPASDSCTGKPKHICEGICAYYEPIFNVPVAWCTHIVGDCDTSGDPQDCIRVFHGTCSWNPIPCHCRVAGLPTTLPVPTCP